MTALLSLLARAVQACRDMRCWLLGCRYAPLLGPGRSTHVCTRCRKTWPT